MEWVWVIVVVAVLFGASRLPQLGRNVGEGIKEFKKGLGEHGDAGRETAIPPRDAGPDDRGDARRL